MIRGWIIRYQSGSSVTIAWRRTRREARQEQLRWPGAVLIRVTG